MYALENSTASAWQRLRVAAAILLLMCAIAGALEWRAQGLRMLSVQTGSMSPLVQAGDALMVRPVDPQSLRPGDVVSFYSPDGSAIVTHRVIESGGSIITQGDANPAPDGALDPALLIGRAERHLVGVGTVIELARSPVGLLVLVYLPALYVVCGETRRLVQFFRPPYRHWAAG